MKSIAVTLFAAALGLAQSQSSTPAATAPATKAAAAAQKKTPAQPSKPKAQPAKAQPAQTQSIPAGAKQVEPGLYRYTDSDGKTWNYRQTPFGVSKWEESSSPAPTPEPAPSKSEQVAVTDLGDSYRFEKKTPFGQSSWVRKKSELNDDEKALTSKPAGNQ